MLSLPRMFDTITTCANTPGWMFVRASSTSTSRQGPAPTPTRLKFGVGLDCCLSPVLEVLFQHAHTPPPPTTTPIPHRTCRANHGTSNSPHPPILTHIRVPSKSGITVGNSWTSRLGIDALIGLNGRLPLLGIGLSSLPWLCPLLRLCPVARVAALCLLCTLFGLLPGGSQLSGDPELTLTCLTLSRVA
jgi:hypothetical protein